MRWQEIEARYPDRGGSTLEGLLTHGARTALGFAVAARDRKDALRRISDAILTDSADRDDRASKGTLGLLAALEGEWDLAGDCTGGPLAGRVVIKKTFDANLVGLARHLAIVARSKLPAAQVLAAMSAVRERLRDDGTGTLDPRAVVLATELFVRDIVRVDDPVAATRAWLDGESLALDGSRPIRAPADGEDPRVKIFERYLPELATEGVIARLLGMHVYATAEPWGRHLEKERVALDDLVVRAFVGRVPLPTGWEDLVDPAVAAWLGAAPGSSAFDVEVRFSDLARIRSGWGIRGDWDDAVFALAVGDSSIFSRLLRDKALPAFKPGRFFKDDAGKLVRYLATAIAMRAGEDAVLPAWLDFLARRSPATTPRLTGEPVPLRWKHLLSIQAAITQRLDGKPRRDVGRRLQQIVTGA